MATYTHEQVFNYLNHIKWPESSKPPEATLDNLQELVLRQLATCPFGSLALHYSQTHLLSLDPEDLFHKIVNRKMGGYCMENNTFFGVVLRSLGYKLINAGARISDATAGRPGPGFAGWTHMVNLVTINDQVYLVDVGFGENGPCRPLPLVSGYETVGNAPQGLRLEYTALPQHTDTTQRLWVYSHRLYEEVPWVRAYAFATLEFFPGDYAVINLATMTLRTSFFVQTLFCVRMLLDEEAGQPAGTLILYHDQVKKKVNGETIVLEQLQSEKQRVDALKAWFGIELTVAEQRGIEELPSELRGWSST